MDLRDELGKIRERAERAAHVNEYGTGDSNLDREGLSDSASDVPRLVEALEVVAKRHQPYANTKWFKRLCAGCGNTWPCQTVQDVTAALDPETPDAAQDAQNRTQSGRAEGAEGGGGSGGLGERLRALGTGQTRALRKALREVADEADRQAHETEGLRLRAELAESVVTMIRQANDENEGAR